MTRDVQPEASDRGAGTLRRSEAWPERPGAEGAKSVRIDVHLSGTDLANALADDVWRGLTASPKELPPKWFYDHRGSELFDEITRLPEYYPTRAERAILEARAGEIAAATRADTLVELGSGTSEKTRLLLTAAAGEGTLTRFVPFDVSEQTLRDAAAAVAREYGVDVHAVVGDFERHLDRLPGGGPRLHWSPSHASGSSGDGRQSRSRRLVAFLGGTIGNLAPAERARFLGTVATGLGPDDAFLLGTDLVKDVARLEAAYDDSAGVTAEFNRNVLLVVNRELGADFDIDAFEHVARWNASDEWIEMLLRSDTPQRVHLEELDLVVDFAAGEEMRTEISAKFRRSGVENELAAAGLTLTEWWTDNAGDFALSLSKPGGD